MQHRPRFQTKPDFGIAVSDKAGPTIDGMVSTLTDTLCVLVPLASHDHGTGKFLVVTDFSIPTLQSRAHVWGRDPDAATWHNFKRRTEADISVVGGIAICRGRFLPHHPLPYRLPLQAPQGQLHDQDLSPQHQLERKHLLGHPEGPMEPCADGVQRYVESHTLQLPDVCPNPC